MYVLLLTLLCFSGVSGVEISEAVDEVPGLRYMGTKTPYVFSAVDKEGKKIAGLESESQDIIDFFKTEEWKHYCKPVHVSATIRHGNRLPSLKNMKLIQRFAAVVRDEFDVNDIKSESGVVHPSVYKMIHDWKLPYKHSEEKSLNDWGYNEIYEIAERFARNYRDLFTKEDFHHEDESGSRVHGKHEILDDIMVMSSDKSRSYNSAKEFLRGLRDVIRNPFIVDAEIEYNNHLTRFHSYCLKFKRIWDSGVLVKELKKYMRSADISEIASKIAKKLGLEHLTGAGKILDKESGGHMAWAIMNACYAESAYQGYISPWCQLLDEEDFKKLAFSNDLKHYYKNTGYVETTGGTQSCELLQHIFHHADKAIVGRRLRRPHKKMVFRFGHAETLIPLYSLMGLYKEDQPLTANYQKHKDRIFNLSRIAPHSANFQLVLYECKTPEEALPVKLEHAMVQVFVNEKEEILPMCKYSLCSYKQVRDFYRQHIDACDIGKICEKNGKSVPDKDEL